MAKKQTRKKQPAPKKKRRRPASPPPPFVEPVDAPATIVDAAATTPDVVSPILTFVREPVGGSTALVTVLITRTETLLGSIRWDQKYRQYAFRPGVRTLYTIRALADIQAELQLLMNQWAMKYGRALRPLS